MERLYRLVLRRPVDPEGDARAVAGLADGTLSRAGLLHELVSSAEFGRVRALDDGLARALCARRANERPRELTAPAATDERLIEIPWTLARYRGEPRVLDIGYAHAEEAYLAALLEAAPAGVTGVDLAEAEVPGVDGIVADVRRLSFVDGSFDVVFCISTLEHVGQDNRVYGVEGGGAGVEAALAELRRVLVRNGRLLVTVPCGAPENHEWFVQRGAKAWLALFRAAGFHVFEEETYALGKGGWGSVADASSARYGEVGPGASAVLCAELRPRFLASSLRRLARAALPGGRGG